MERRERDTGDWRRGEGGGGMEGMIKNLKEAKRETERKRKDGKRKCKKKREGLGRGNEKRELRRRKG